MKVFEGFHFQCFSFHTARWAVHEGLYNSFDGVNAWTCICASIYTVPMLWYTCTCTVCMVIHYDAWREYMQVYNSQYTCTPFTEGMGCLFGVEITDGTDSKTPDGKKGQKCDWEVRKIIVLAIRHDYTMSRLYVRYMYMYVKQLSNTARRWSCHICLCVQAATEAPGSW